jgi:hypothetical protein
VEALPFLRQRHCGARRSNVGSAAREHAHREQLQSAQQSNEQPAKSFRLATILSAASASTRILIVFVKIRKFVNQQNDFFHNSLKIVWIWARQPVFKKTGLETGF